MEFVPQAMMNRRSNKSKRKQRSVNSLLKVVYISSPMKVETSAARFRTLVQELTGRDSDISRFMDVDANTSSPAPAARESDDDDFEILTEIKRVSSKSDRAHNHNHHHQHHEQKQQRINSSSSSSFSLVGQDSPTSSESHHHDDDQVVLQPPTFEDAFINEHYFQGLLSSDLFTDSSEFDVLGSYDAL